MLILDSLDQLSSSNYPYRLTWLPWNLPPHVHIIVSTLPTEQKILGRLKIMVSNEDNFVEVPPLGENISFDIIKSWLQDINKTLTMEQYAIVQTALNECSLPLYTKLVFEEVKRWKSYTPLDMTQLEHTVKGSINMLFDKIEIHHGKKLVSRALSYLTASRSGLTEAELEDILSLDDDVLDEIFTFWIPPIRRIPPLLWTRVRNDLLSYLVEREADGISVYGWYHRQFREAIRDRYFLDRNFRLIIHSSMADYFLGKWSGGKKKPFRYSDIVYKRMSLKTRDGSADRKLPSQPLKWKTRSTKRGMEVRYNLRKLTELPYHLYRSERYDELWKEVFYNYGWLHAKVKATSVMDVLADATLVHRKHRGDRIGLLMSALKVAGSSNTLAPEILGRLKQQEGQFDLINNLVSQCRLEGIKHCCLLPAFQCFNAPVEALLFSLEGHHKQVIDIVFSRDSQSVHSVSMDSTIATWDTRTGDQLFPIKLTYSIPSQHSKLHIDRNGHIILENYTEKSPLCIFDAQTGNLRHSVSERPTNFTHNTQVLNKLALREGELINTEIGKVVKSLECLKSKNNFVAIAMTPDEKHLLIGENDATIMVDMATEETVCSFEQRYIPSQIVISESSTQALIGYSVDCTVRVLDIDKASDTFGEVVFTFDYTKAFPDKTFASGVHCQQEVFDLSLNCDGTHFVVNIKRLELFVVSMETGKALMMEMEVFSEQELVIYSSGFNYDGTCVVAIVGNNMCIWDTRTGELHAHMRLVGSEDDQFVLALAPSLNIAATVSKQETIIKLWDLDKLQDMDKSQNIHVYNNPVDCVTMVPQLKLAYLKTYRCLNSKRGYQFLDYFGLDVWNLSTNNWQHYLPFGKYGQLIQLHASIDGHYLVMLTETKSTTHIYLVNVRKGKVMAHLHQPGCYCVTLSPDNKYLLTEGQECKLWDLRAANLVKVFNNCHSGVFSPDARFLLFISDKKKILYFSLETLFTQFCSLKKISPMGLDPILNKPNQVLVTSAATSGELKKYSKVEIWDFKKRVRLHKFESTGPSGMKDISKNGSIAVDGYLQVYDLDNGNTIVPQTSISVIEFSEVKVTDDGQYVLWGDQTPTNCLKVMRVSDGHIVAEVSTHSRVMSLNLADHGYLVVAGCEDGHFLTFRLHKVKDMDSDLDEVSHDFNGMIDIDGDKRQKSASKNSLSEEVEVYSSRSGSKTSVDELPSERKPRSKSKLNLLDLLTCRSTKIFKSYSRSKLPMIPSTTDTLSLGRAQAHRIRSRSLSSTDARSRSASNSRTNQLKLSDSVSTSASDIIATLSKSSLSRLNLDDKFDDTVDQSVCTAISNEDLYQLDSSYQWKVQQLKDSDMPKAGDKIKEALEIGAQFSYTMSCNSEPNYGLEKTNSKTCKVM